MSFPAESPAGAYQASLHAAGLLPSQLFEAVGGLAVAAIVILAGRKTPFDGLQFYLAGLLYAVLRFWVDLTRYYPPDERIWRLSHNQVPCIVLIGLFLSLMLLGRISTEKASSRFGL